MTSPEPSPSELVHEAKELDAQAARLHAQADATPLGSAEHQAAEDADQAADQEWKAADAVTSKIEGFTPGEILE